MTWTFMGNKTLIANYSFQKFKNNPKNINGKQLLVLNVNIRSARKDFQNFKTFDWTFSVIT